MKARQCVFFILLLVFAATARGQGGKYVNPDQSVRGGEYAVLNNLLMQRVERVEYAGREHVYVYGKPYEASKFVVYTTVIVTVTGPHECLPDHQPLQPCDGYKDAEIEVYVGRDEAGEIHDEMLRRVRDYWSAHKLGRGKKAQTDEHLNYQNGEYIMFQETAGGPDGRSRAKRLVWVGGKFVKFNFRRFALRQTIDDIAQSPLDRDEGLDDFVSRKLYVRPRAARIRPERMKGAFREEFFRLDAAGAFDAARGMEARRRPLSSTSRSPSTLPLRP